MIIWLLCEYLSHNHNLNLHYCGIFRVTMQFFLTSSQFVGERSNKMKSLLTNLLEQNAVKNHEFWKYKPQRQSRCPSGWNTVGKSCTTRDVDRAIKLSLFAIWRVRGTTLNRMKDIILKKKSTSKVHVPSRCRVSVGCLNCFFMIQQLHFVMKAWDWCLLVQKSQL